MLVKLFNEVSIVGGVVGGFLCSFLGGYDLILKSLIAIIILDYITGILKAIYNKKLSSQAGFKGLIRKIIVFIVVATAVIIQQVIGGVIPLRETVIIFFICNEAISLLENASEFIPIPQKLKDVLIQLREKNEEGDSND
jgi:toxin secretion/phage lysis holin